MLQMVLMIRNRDWPNVTGNACNLVTWIGKDPIVDGVRNEADTDVPWGTTAVLDLALELRYPSHSGILNQGCFLSNSVEFYCWCSWSPRSLIGWGFLSLMPAVNPTSQSSIPAFARGPGETTAQKPWTERNTGLLPILLGFFSCNSSNNPTAVTTRVGVSE